MSTRLIHGRWVALHPGSTEIMKTLDQEFEDHLANSADKLNFQIYDRDWNANQWSGSIKLRNDQLRIELYCERGLLSLNISPQTGKENFIDAELLNSYLTLQEETEQLTKWARKKIVNRRIGLDEQVNLLTSKRTNLEQIFSKKQLKKTLKELQQLGEERFNNSL
ncbi:hypothetical protein [Marinoscillum sp. MHG1-6]|uniref:hypothetical protein n=1 Tax=Marinoscillum sp. MHG1-6 TaxID=2959627 RepID=UPI0021586B5C|nr:hypothetical protein [Marinoscillum sp. MHG1-6]